MFTVHTFTGWDDHSGMRSPGFATADDAIAVARYSVFPLVDVVDTSTGLVIATRRLVPHPATRPDPADPFVPRDDFPCDHAVASNCPHYT